MQMPSSTAVQGSFGVWLTSSICTPISSTPSSRKATSAATGIMASPHDSHSEKGSSVSLRGREGRGMRERSVGRAGIRDKCRVGAEEGRG